MTEQSSERSVRPETAEQEQDNAPTEKKETSQATPAERSIPTPKDRPDTSHDNSSGKTATEEAEHVQQRQLESGEENPA